MFWDAIAFFLSGLTLRATNLIHPPQYESVATEFSLKPENSTGQITRSHTLITLAYQHISRKGLLQPQQTLSGHNRSHRG